MIQVAHVVESIPNVNFEQVSHSLVRVISGEKVFGYLSSSGTLRSVLFSSFQDGLFESISSYLEKIGAKPELRLSDPETRDLGTFYVPIGEI